MDGSLAHFLISFNKFFACCSALCGLLADAEGGTIFRFEDNTCTVATYRGPLGAYQDGEVGLYYLQFLNHWTGFHIISYFRNRSNLFL